MVHRFVNKDADDALQWQAKKPHHTLEAKLPEHIEDTETRINL